MTKKDFVAMAASIATIRNRKVCAANNAGGNHA